MKRLLTYGLLLLTILASHFVVSACQDDLPETTDIMVTFTTRATPGGVDSDSPELEQMHDLSVIMLRGDGTIVGKDSYKPEEGEKNPSSVIFSFSTTIPNPSGEDFTFLAIANEESIDGTLPWKDLSVGEKLSESVIKALTINTDINCNPMPQTDYWTVHVPQEHNHKVNKTLQFAGSKISVVFNNMTKEAQSLSNIHITGITPNTQGYLFKQDGTDYIDSKDNSATPISWDKDLTLAAPTTGDDGKTIYASDSVAYYTYPLGEGNISSPMLCATWGEETEPRTLDLSGITSLKRNEHLRIEITLTPAGDITVNYTIADWEETPTTIGGEAPTTPGNGYNTQDWTAGNDINIGGGEDDDALGFIPEGTTAVGGFDNVDWATVTSASENSIFYLGKILQEIGVDQNTVIQEGNILALQFNGMRDEVSGYFYFTLDWYAGNIGQEEYYLFTPPCYFEGKNNNIIHFTFSNDMNGYTVENIFERGGVTMRTYNTGEGEDCNVEITRIGIFKPNS